MRRDKTDEIVMESAGAVIKDQGLAGTQNMYINPCSLLVVLE